MRLLHNKLWNALLCLACFMDVFPTRGKTYRHSCLKGHGLGQMDSFDSYPWASDGGHVSTALLAIAAGF